VAFKPSAKRKASKDQIEPEILPIMNLVIVLIPMLLSVAQFVQIALLEYAPPPIEDTGGGDGGGGGGGAETATLNLLLNISETGFEVSMFGATSGENFKAIAKKPDGSFDYDALHKELVRVRQNIIGKPISSEETTDPVTGKTGIENVFKYTDAEMMKITAKGEVPWKTLVGVLDASREFEDDDGLTKPLFQQPIMGQIQ
jgi:hypothetical protein